MKIQFKKIITKQNSIVVFDGDKNIVIPREDFEKLKTVDGSIPLNKWCSDLNDLKVTGLEEHPVDFDKYQQETVKRSIHIGIQPMAIGDLQAYPFDDKKIYKLHLNDLNDAGLDAYNEAKPLTEIIQTNKNIVEVDLESNLISIPDNAFLDSSFTDIHIPETITEIGENCFSGCKKLKNINIPVNLTTLSAGVLRDCISINKLELPKSLTTIGANAFNNCKSLLVADIPSSVNSIGVGAFENCGLLQKVDIPNGLAEISDRAFLNCKNIFNIDIPESLVTIGANSFEGCVNLSKLKLPLGVAHIKNNAFLNTSIRVINTEKTIAGWYEVVPDKIAIGLSDEKLVINCPDGIIKHGFTELNARNFSELQTYNFLPDITYRVHLNNENFTHVGADSTELPDLIKVNRNIKEIVIDTEVTSIPENAFKGCDSLTSIKVPNTITSIGDRAFYECRELPTLIIPATISSIGSLAFGYCDKLNNITIPLSVVSIGHSAFENCIGLTSISMEHGLTTLRPSTFKGCTALNDVTVPYSVTKIDSNVFENCSGLVNLTIENGVEELGDNVFLGCSSISSIVLPNSITKIGTTVFKDCIGLTSIKIPNTVTSMGTSNFINCTGLEQAILGDGLTAVESSTFEGCTSLSDVHLGDSILEIKDKAFFNCSSLVKVNIPDSVISIKENAFSGCSGLKNIHLGLGVTSIGVTSFENCIGLTEINIPEGVNSIGHFAFTGTSITTINTPKTIAKWYELVPDETEIGLSGITVNGKDGSVSPDLTEVFAKSFEELQNYDFISTTNYRLHLSAENLTHPEISDIIRNNTSIKDIVVDNSTEPIELRPSVFENCTSLRYISLGNNVTTISDTSFAGCTGLKDLIVVEENNSLKSIDNIIYDKQATKLFVCSMGNTGEISSIPETVEVIENNAFKNCTGLTGVTLSPALTHIGTYAFDGCSGISRINISDKIVAISEHAFEGTSIKTVDFGRSVTEWYKLIPDMQVIGLNPIDTTINCSDGNITNEITEILSRPFSDLQAYEFISTINYKVHLNDESMKLVGKFGSELPTLIRAHENIKEIVIDPDVAVIQEMSFAECMSLVKVYIPVEVTEVQKNAFIQCDAIVDVVYGGTMDQWKALVPSLVPIELEPSKVTITCSDGVIPPSPAA